MTYRFVDNSMKNIIEQLVDNEFPNMGAGDLNIIKKYFISFIEVLSHIMKFQHEPFDTNNQYIINDNKQNLLNNGGLNIRWLLTYILPFITNTNGKSRKDLTSLQEIYTEKLEDVDINKVSPTYVYSNIQYGRCIRDNKKNIREISFSENHIRDNYFLLIDTLKDCSNKMHVNWKNILPYTTDHEKSNLYKTTLDKYESGTIRDWDPYDLCNPENLQNNDTILKLADETKGLDIGVIYDTISNLLYEYILPIKWMIYDVPIVSKVPSRPASRLPLILVLNDNLVLEEIAGSNHIIYWDSISKKSQDTFISKWNMLKKRVQISKNYNCMTYEVTSDYIAMMVKSLLIGFNFGVKDMRNALTLKYKPFKMTDEIKRIIDDQEERLNNLDISFFNDSLNSVPPSSLYDYLVDSVYKLKNSWCSRYLMKTMKTVSNIKTVFTKDHVNSTKIDGTFNASYNQVPLLATVKNYYNYYKSMVHITEGRKFIRLPKRWKSLDDAQKLEFSDKLKKSTDKSKDAPIWFSITKYIRTYIYEPHNTLFNPINTRDIIRLINNDIYYYVNEKVIDEVFSVLITNGILTYFEAVPNEEIDYKSIFKQDNSNKFWNGAYHYLTNRPFSQTGEYDFLIKGVHTGNIFSYNIQYKWYQRASMHWVSQIGLCHKIIHQRVHFITGGTGIGKSSVVPILYMYYQKALDYNMSGSVVCTMPRVQPTQETARNSAAQVGLPITVDDIHYDVRNYNIQMAHQKKKHVDNGEYLKLKFCTDGSLLMDLKNPMLKEFTDKKRTRYLTHNKYDVIIVDEAHEHNANMDIILSIVRNIAHYNNSIKVVIMSATIDDDEPTYRRFYRDINDNRKYPLCRWIEKNKIDRVNIDRRLHIAEPDSDTQYHIDDIYMPGIDADSLVSEIMSSTTSGYGLLFRPGKAEIDKSVAYINQHTPSNIIALPYLASLDDTAKKFVKDIDTTLPQLRIAKTDDLGKMGRDGKLEEGAGRYDRCVIVATNIAEASITINKLEFVFETGQQKKQIYNYKVRSATLKTEGITESSRKQRRGRVGRTAPGKAYYMYAKDTMKYNRFLFDISISDQTFNLLALLQDTYVEQQFINIDVNTTSELSMDDIKNLQRGYKEIIENQYFIKGVYYSYMGNNTQYDYGNYRNCNMFYETGYKFQDVIDYQGQFYAVHPDELQFTRNINGEITGALSSDIEIIIGNKKFNRIKSKKIEAFMDNLVKNMLLAYNGNHAIKTVIGKYINAIYEDLQQSGAVESIYDTLMLIYSAVFNNTDDIIRYICLKSAIGADLKKLFIFSGGRFTKTQVQHTISDNHTSDISSLIQLTKMTDNVLTQLNIPITFNDPQYINKIDDEYLQLIQTILTTNDNTSKNELNESVKNILDNGEGGDENDDYNISKRSITIFTKYVDEIMEIIYGKLNNSEVFRRRMADFGVNYETVINYYKNYNMLLKHIILLKIDNSTRNIMTLREIGKIMEPIKQITNSDDPITHCLLLSRPYNVVKYITNTHNKYLDVFGPIISNMKSYASIAKARFIPSTLMTDTNIKSYLYYDNYNVTTNEISITHKISPDALAVIGHICTLREMHAKYNKTLTKKLEEYDSDDIRAVLNYGRTFNEIFGDLSKHKNYIIWNVLPQIDSAFTEYARTMEEFDRYGRIITE